MIFFFPESSHRAAARGTVPDRFRLIPEDFFEKVAPKIEVPAPRRARYVPAFQKIKKIQNYKNKSFFHEIGLHKPEFDENWAGLHQISRRFSWCYSRRKKVILNWKNNDSMIFHEIGLHKPDFDETWAGLHQISRRFSWCYSRIKRIF